MKNNTEDKAERILTIYTKLKQGKVIYREELSEKYGVSSRAGQGGVSCRSGKFLNQDWRNG